MAEKQNIKLKLIKAYPVKKIGELLEILYEISYSKNKYKMIKNVNF